MTEPVHFAERPVKAPSLKWSTLSHAISLTVSSCEMTRPSRDTVFSPCSSHDGFILGKQISLSLIIRFQKKKSIEKSL